MMISAEPVPLDPELRDILENLASGLFPLDAWIKGKTFKPAVNDLPWRSGGEPLSPKAIGVMSFFEALLRETSGDALLIGRWHQLIAEPFLFSARADMEQWRAIRGLEAKAEFGALESENVLSDFEGKPISRAGFYAAYFPLLRLAVKAAAAQGPIQWDLFAANLFKDEKDIPNPVWPKGQPRRSSNFIKQFSKDLLYATMGMRNAAPAPFNYALLIELGEHRRVGNSYTPKDPQRAVKELKEVIAKVTAQPPPPGTPVPASVPPVGAPRIGSPLVGSPSVISATPPKLTARPKRTVRTKRTTRRKR
jgi:hypothetical protein